MDLGEFGGSGMRVKRMTASKSQPRRITMSVAGVKRHDDGEAPSGVGAAGETRRRMAEVA
jgi:hypothetical protein